MTQKENHVLRYIGEIDIESNIIEVKLVSEPINSALGQLKGTDNLVEIYTKSNGVHPIIIQGGGTGKQIVARGVLNDILKISDRIQQLDRMKQKETVWL